MGSPTPVKISQSTLLAFDSMESAPLPHERYNNKNDRGDRCIDAEQGHQAAVGGWSGVGPDGSTGG
mgnify:CR=1 FL=1